MRDLDVHGFRVARITYEHHPNDRTASAQVMPYLQASQDEMGPSSRQPALGFVQVPDSIGGLVNHQMGTMRMGSSADSSAVDPSGRLWGVPNLYVADGSVFPTSGGYNPSLTIQAMAWRTADNIVASGQA